jgi:hypothetical protein
VTVAHPLKCLILGPRATILPTRHRILTPRCEFRLANFRQLRQVFTRGDSDRTRGREENKAAAFFGG